MYREMLIHTVLFAVQNEITSFIKLKAERYYYFLRETHPQLPSHYTCTVCQDSALRAKSFLKRTKRDIHDKIAKSE